MMSRWWKVLTFGLLALVGCARLTAVPRGTVIGTNELEPNKTELASVVARELKAEHVARAFYVAEVDKTRQFASLATRSAAAKDISPATLQLKPIEAKDATTTTTAGSETTRGFTLVDEAPQAIRALNVENDDRYWKDQHEVDAIWKSVETRNIPYGLAFRGRLLISTVEEVQRTLGPKQVMLSYFVGADAVYAFAITQKKSEAYNLGAPDPILQKVQALVRATRKPNGDYADLAADMYKALVGPAEKLLEDADAVTIVPHRFISNVPFVVLKKSATQPMMIERFTVSYLPSASFYATLLQRPLFADPPRMLAIGNPTFPKPWPALPDAEREARAVARVFDDSLALQRGAATEERFYDTYRDFNVLHFATHGMLAGTLSSATSSLVVAPSKSSDGYITATEISRLDLSRCYLAVLSACETSVATGSGASLDSISAAFLAAGAGSVVGSQWQVSDQSTAELMIAFYSQFLEQGSARALRSAQLGLMKNSATKHPFFWAAFVLYGWDR